MSQPEAQSSERLLELLRQAREFITESQKHWGSIQHLTGDRRNQKRSAEEIRAVVDEAFSKLPRSFTPVTASSSRASG